jgi:hypothetical protein
LRPCIERAGGRIVAVEQVPVAEGVEWSRIRIEVPADEEGSADLLTSLVKASVPISRFTRDDLSLADLIERVKADHVDGVRKKSA